MEKSWNCIFWSNISCCLKTGNIILIIEQNMPQKAKFSAFLSHGKFKLIMEKPLDFIVQFFVIPVGDIYFERVPQ